MNQRTVRSLGPIFWFFIILNSLLIVFRKEIESRGVESYVVIAGNLLLCIVTIVSFSLAKKGLSNENPHAFVRSVYTSMMVKLFVCIIAAFAYFYAAGKEINKPALFICMGLYLVYTFMEVSLLTKMLRSKPHV